MCSYVPYNRFCKRHFLHFVIVFFIVYFFLFLFISIYTSLQPTAEAACSAK